MIDNNIHSVFNKWYEETKFGKTPDESATNELLELLELQQVDSDADMVIYNIIIDTLAQFYTEELPRRKQKNG